MLNTIQYRRLLMQVAVIFGLTQVPGYTESAFVLGTTPTMIYIDPGVDWVFNLTVLGDVPITAIGSKLTVRGSGWESIMHVSQTGTTFELMDTDTSTELQFLDIKLETRACYSRWNYYRTRFSSFCW